MTVKNILSQSTIEDVAKRANVSIATISRTLHKPDLVSPKTRKRVQKVIAELNYTQNKTAQNLRLARTNTIAILLPDIGNSFFSAIIRGMEEEATKEKYDILIAPTHASTPAENVYRKYMSQRLADGILTLNGELPIPIEYLKQRDDISPLLPIVMVCELLSDRLNPVDMLKFKNQISTVSIDNQHAAYVATKHLFDLGHKNILHIAGPEDNVLSWERVEGFKTAVLHQGIDSPDDYIIHTHTFNTDGGQEAFDKVRTHPKTPTALFCASDTIALGFMTACREHHIQLPQEYSIVGFDNIRIAQHTFPSLTTIHQPREELGRVAMRTLIQRIKDRSTPLQNIVLNTYLIERNSAISHI